MDFSVSTIILRGYARCQAFRGQALSQVLQVQYWGFFIFYSPHLISRGTAQVYYFRFEGVASMPAGVAPGD